jgi:hypothetical protein
LDAGPVSPRVPLGRNSIAWYSGDEHNEVGHVSENSTNRTIMYDKRMKKLELAEKEYMMMKNSMFLATAIQKM